MQQLRYFAGRWRSPFVLAFVAWLATATPAFAAPFGFVDPVTPYGEQVNFLYQLMIWISIGILVVVEVALVMALWKFRKKPGEVREPETWSHNTKLEIIWTVIPSILLLIILVPTMQAIWTLADVPKKPELTLEVVGRQFFWEYRYPELGVQFSSTPRLSDAPQESLLIPVNRKMKVILTGADVIHSWWVPAFGLQQMTTPGYLAQVPLIVTKIGDYEGACAFLCGPYHGAMNIKVSVVDQPTFDAWAAKKKAAGPIDPIAKVGKVGLIAPPPSKEHETPQGSPTPDAASTALPSSPAIPAANGPALYATCAGCHGAKGEGQAIFPPLAGAEQVNGDDDTLIKGVLKGFTGAIKVKGKDYNGMMPAQSHMSDDEVAAVLTFVRSQWGNNGKPITPAQVKANR